MASTHDELFAAIAGGDLERVRSLLGAEPSLATGRDDQGVSALMRARYRLDMALTEVVLTHAGDLDVFEAASFDDLDRLAEVLDADQQIADARSGDGFTALHFAAFFGKPQAARMLIDRGADPDAHGRGWMTGTPLHSAASAGHADIALMLLEAGGDPNARQSGGWTPLHSAAHNGDAETARTLLDHGADPELTADDGRDAEAMARESGDAGTITRLADRAGG